MNTVLLNIQLDATASMQRIREATVSQFAELIRGLRSDGNDYRLMLSQFSLLNDKNTPTVRYVCEGISLSNFEGLDYHPNGMTPLNDAIAEGLLHADEWLKREAAEGRTYRVLNVTLTDGEENSSRRYTHEQVVAMIEQRKATGFWTFVFLGADIDAWHVGGALGVNRNNTLQVSATPDGIKDGLKQLRVSTSHFATSLSASTDKFFDGDA